MCVDVVVLTVSILLKEELKPSFFFCSEAIILQRSSCWFLKAFLVCSWRVCGTVIVYESEASWAVPRVPMGVTHTWVAYPSILDPNGRWFLRFLRHQEWAQPLEKGGASLYWEKPRNGEKYSSLPHHFCHLIYSICSLWVWFTIFGSLKLCFI